MSGFIREKSYLVPWVILGLGAMTVASAQTSNSPFASKVKKKAWETTSLIISLTERAEPHKIRGQGMEVLKPGHKDNMQNVAGLIGWAFEIGRQPYQALFAVA